jgi:hypothetical protein
VGDQPPRETGRLSREVDGEARLATGRLEAFIDDWSCNGIGLRSADRRELPIPRVRINNRLWPNPLLLIVELSILGIATTWGT